MTRRPLQSSFRYRLPDGTPVTLRWIRPDDKKRLQAGIKLFSPQTLYRRFFIPITELSEAQLKFLTEVDQVNHIAWGALDDGHPEIPGLGVARCVRLPDYPEIAESAITILDGYQNRGLGTLLLGVLNLCAAEQGIKLLRSYVLAENTPFIGKLRRLGAETRHEGEGLMRLDLPVYARKRQLPDNPSAQIYWGIIRALDKVMRK